MKLHNNGEPYVMILGTTQMLLLSAGSWVLQVGMHLNRGLKAVEVV